MIVTMTPVWRALATVLGTGAAVAGWATLVEPHAFTLRRFDVPVLPAGSRPLRVLHLSDLHLTPRQRDKIRWVRELAVLEPDLVVTTGDNIAHQDAVPALLEAYEPLLSVPGVFVLGSNDYFPPKLKNPLRYFDDSHPRGSTSTTPASASTSPPWTSSSWGWTTRTSATTTTPPWPARRARRPT